MPNSLNLAIAIFPLVLFGIFSASPIAISKNDDQSLSGEENRTFMQTSLNVVRSPFAVVKSSTDAEEGKNAATCYDSRLANFINYGLSYYSHNMGQLANYVLNQIKLARMPGYWFVHAEMIGGQQQGVQWQSAATGDIFAPSSRHGCYYHDTQTYLIVLNY